MIKLLLIIWSLTVFMSFGQGYQVNLQGQVQQGMGGAGTALLKDAATTFFNPAGLSFLEENQVIVGMTPTFANGTFLENETNETATTNSPMGTPFAVYANYKTKTESKLGFGLGVYTPFGSTVQWEDGWLGRFALTRLKLLSIYVQPTISYAITDKISLGAGFIYSYGKVNLQKDIPVQFEDETYSTAELDGSGNGYGFNAGIYYAPIEQLSFGITYRSQINMNVDKGTATFTVPTSLADKFPSGDFTSSLPLPSVFTVSAAGKPMEKLNLVVDVNYTEWAAYDTLAFDYALNTESLEDTKSAREYENTFAFRIGGEYQVDEKFAVRFGFARAFSPVQDGYLTPETPDANRSNITFGVGYKLTEQIGIDASILYTSITREDTNYETQLSGTYKTSVIAPGISVSYNF